MRVTEMRNQSKKNEGQENGPHFLNLSFIYKTNVFY